MELEKQVSSLLSRRGFIKTATASALSLAVAPFFSHAEVHTTPHPNSVEQGISEGSFKTLSEFLTGRVSLDPGISKRALQSLIAVDPDFGFKALKLNQAIKKEKLSDMSSFENHFSAQSDLKQVAITIISAWYLGYTGTPLGESNSDNAHFVSYEGALMYEPTMDATIIPTFARGKTNYWAEPPKLN